MGFEPTAIWFLNKHSTICPNWPNDWDVFSVFICTMHLTVFYYRVTYVFLSESTLYICLNLKELLAQNKRDIWRLSDCNNTWTQNHLVFKRKLNHLTKLTKWLSCVVSTYLYGEFDCTLSSCHVRLSDWIHTPYLPDRQETPFLKQAQYLKIKWLQRDSHPQPFSS